MPDPREVLAEIRNRAGAAIPGPWDSSIEGRDHLAGDDAIFTPGADMTVNIIFWNEPAPPIPTQVTALAATQDFIAAARSDVPRLVAALTAVLDLVCQTPDEVLYDPYLDVNQDDANLVLMQNERIQMSITEALEGGSL